MKAKRQAGRILSNEKGFVLPLAFIFLSIIALLGATAVIVATTDLRIATNYKTSVQASFIAEAGIQRAVWQLRQDWNNTAAGRDDYFGVGQYDYTITTCSVNPYLRIITSIGKARGGEERIEVRVTRLPIPTLPAAYLGGSNVEIEFSGSAFSISGVDTNPDGTLGPGPSVLGITINQNAIFSHNLNLGQKNNIVGSLGEILSPASIGRISEPIDIASLASRYIEIADRVYGDDTELNDIWGTPANPQVSYVTGDLGMTGNSSGAGVLIVRGKLGMTGNSSWVGIVIVLGEETELSPDGDCKLKEDYILGGNPRIFGALLIQGDDKDGELDVRGNVHIYHSSQAISMVEEELAPVIVRSWREI